MKTYNLFGFITIKLITDRRNYRRYFDNEYNSMSRGEQSDARITVEITNEMPEAGSRDVYVKRRFKSLFTYEYLVRDLDTATPKIYFRPHPVDRLYINAIAVFVQAQLLEPIMYLKLLERGIFLMHAAGVASGHRGALFPAHGGTGKTTTALRLVHGGFRLLGDDLLVIDARNGRVHAYPRPLHLFSYNIDSLHGTSVPLGVRLAIRSKNVLRFFLEGLTGEEFLISTRVHAEQLYGADIFDESASIGRIVFLRKSGDSHGVELTDPDAVESFARAIIEAGDLNQSLVTNCLLDDDARAKLKELELQAALEVLRRADGAEYLNTRQMLDPDWAEFGKRLRSQLET